jgi:hypothetical protein
MLIKGHPTQNFKYTFFNSFQYNKTKKSTPSYPYDNSEHRVIVMKFFFRKLPETVDNLLNECPNEHDVTLAKTTQFSCWRTTKPRCTNG